MRKQLWLLIVAKFFPSYLLAQNQDETTVLVGACGLPQATHDKRLPHQASGATQRELDYPKVDFLFYRDNANRRWGLTGAFLHGGDDTIDRETVVSLMPCLSPAVFTYTLRPAAAVPAQSPSATKPPTGDDSSLGWTALICVLLIIGALIYRGMLRDRAWAGRPKRLCMNCKSVRQPLQLADKEWYCPVCQHRSPVPLDSPAAIAHLGDRV